MGSYLTPDSGSTNSLKSPGKRMKDELGVQTPTQLVDDIINEVIDHLLAISNFRFKCVSKHWFFLNTEALKRKSQTSTLSGIFYTTTNPMSNVMVEYVKLQKDQNEDSSIDETLSFIPNISKLRYLRIYDSCGGLLLCGCSDEHGFCLLYVCNPATRKWVKIRHNPCEFISVAILDCKPLVSVHFNVMIKLCICQDNVEVFASETGKWKVISQLKTVGSSAISFKGLIFDINCEGAGIGYGYDMEGNICCRIDFPGLSHPKDWCFDYRLGQSGGYLHYCYSSKSEAYVWKLVDYESGPWSLKTSFQIMNPHNKLVRIIPHPDNDDVVFVGIGIRWHSYNMQTTQMVEISSGVDMFNLLLYSLCYLDGLGNNEVEGK